MPPATIPLGPPPTAPEIMAPDRLAQSQATSERREGPTSYGSTHARLGDDKISNSKFNALMSLLLLRVRRTKIGANLNSRRMPMPL